MKGWTTKTNTKKAVIDMIVHVRTHLKVNCPGPNSHSNRRVLKTSVHGLTFAETLTSKIDTASANLASFVNKSSIAFDAPTIVPHITRPLAKSSGGELIRFGISDRTSPMCH